MKFYLLVCLLFLINITYGSFEANKVHESQSQSSYYLSHIKPIFENRCVACHACEAAPCQLKLDSFEGFDRGATTSYPKAIKLAERPMTRIFKDAKTTAHWRDKGFWSIVNRDANLSDGDRLQQSLLYRFIKQSRDQSKRGEIIEKTPREFKKCVKDIKQFEQDFAKKDNIHRGMPFGLKPLNDDEFNAIQNWVILGSKGPTENEFRRMKMASNRTTIDKWEKFLNQPNNKNAWTAKYLYEHLFLAHFHFDDNPGEFFELQRSKPNVNEFEIDEIVTKFPYNDPIEKFEYRFNRVHSSIAHKTHIVYEVKNETLDEIVELFIDSNWGKNIPKVSYDEINPFYNFKPIPAKVRYKYLIYNSRLMMDFFTRGPVCSGGQLATWVLQDHTWAIFEDPEFDITATDEYYSDNNKVQMHLKIPTMNKTKRAWPYYSVHTKKYERIHAKKLEERFPNGRGLDVIWNGNKGSQKNGNEYNPNALLTLYRHSGYSVSVHKGQIGEVPKTFALLNYSIFERVYYDLVAGLNIYGGLNHKLNLRLMITHLRREMEDNFISLLPISQRKDQREKWYKSYMKHVKEFHFDKIKSKIRFDKKHTAANGDHAKNLAINIINTHLKNVSGPIDPISGHARHLSTPKVIPFINDEKSLNDGLKLISGKTGGFAQYLPEVSYFAFKLKSGKLLYYTVNKNIAHKSVHYLFKEKNQIDHQNTTLNIQKDFPLSFPQLFMQIDINKANRFISNLAKLNSAKSFQKIENEFGIQKNDDRFWKFYDDLNNHHKKIDPINYGILDLNRYGYHHFPGFKF
ncbi:fatty acid cis/trans isomerase [Bacteriovoracaceae bacterium]|nr:fatty acid cis/trans isomerase [Bacteriovoracaceae bacterium]